MRPEETKTMRGELILLDPEQVEIVPGFNSRRFETGSIAGLAAELLAAGGNEIPIRVRSGKNGGGYLVTWGERRVRAAMHIRQNGLDKDISGGFKLRAEVVDYAPDEPSGDSEELGQQLEMLAFNDTLLENNRADLSDVDRAHAIARLEGYKMPRNEIAKKLGISNSTVTEIAPIISLPLKIQKAIHDRKIARGTGLALLELEEADREQAAAEILEELAGRRVTKDDAVRKVKKKKGQTAESKRPGLKVVRQFWAEMALPAGDEAEGQEKSKLRLLGEIVGKMHDGKLVPKTALKKVAELLEA